MGSESPLLIVDQYILANDNAGRKYTLDKDATTSATKRHLTGKSKSRKRDTLNTPPSISFSYKTWEKSVNLI